MSILESSRSLGVSESLRNHYMYNNVFQPFASVNITAPISDARCLIKTIYTYNYPYRIQAIPIFNSSYFLFFPRKSYKTVLPRQERRRLPQKLGKIFRPRTKIKIKERETRVKGFSEKCELCLSSHPIHSISCFFAVVNAHSRPHLGHHIYSIVTESSERIYTTTTFLRSLP